MFGRSRSKKLKESGASGGELALALAKDKKFRREIAAAIGHGTKARRRARRQIGAVAAARRLATDEALRRQVAGLVASIDNAWGRVEKKRSHRLRNSLLVLGVGGGAAAAATRPEVRRLLTRILGGAGGAMPSQARTITETIEVAAPVSAVYNQWTQFEDFPLFMEGVDHVQQVDDTRLHWTATVAGKSAEWDAKILEQHPDRQISWISEDGKATRGTVTFDERGPERTLVTLSMSYKAEGLAETLGSAAGLDSRRVRSDLERFKELIESRGGESGGWRGEVREGDVTR